MHEALITKGMARGNKFGLKINHECNCVIIHHECHKPGIGSEEIYRACLLHLIAFEGYGKIIDWFDEMAEYMPNVAREARLRFINTNITIHQERKEQEIRSMWDE